MRVFIAGGGHCAEFIARRLIREGNDLVIVEKDEARCQYLEGHFDAKIIQGDAASVATWRDAGLNRAEMMIAVTHCDEINVMACLIADSEAPDAIKAMRLRTWEFDEWHRILAARGIRIDRVIHPETDVVARIFKVLTVPGVSDIRDFASGEVKAFGMNVEPGARLAGMALSDLARLDHPKNAMIAMIFRGPEVIIPHGDEVLQAGDHIYVVTTREELDATLRFMGIEKQESIHRVFIVGAGDIGIAIAGILEDQGVSVKVFEQDERQCEIAAAALRKSVVIHGDGSDQDTLTQENIEGVDAFIALTKDDDANMIASLLARRLGARKLVALVNRVHNLLLAQRLGINTTVSRRVKTVDAILEFFRKGGVVSVRTFREEEAEALELVAPARSPYVGRPLKEIPFPRGAVVAAVASPDGAVRVPRGEDVIEPGDRVVFIALESCVAALESDFLAEADASKWSIL